METFRDAAALHAELDQLFYDHQCALLDFDFQGALARLEAYERALLAHMRAEEELLLPLYVERAEAPRGGAPQFFHLEHAKMRRLLAHFRAELPRLIELPNPRRALLKLLDLEATYKHLSEHHVTREEKFLFPALDRVTSPAERAGLLARLAAAEAPPPAAGEPPTRGRPLTSRPSVCDAPHGPA